MRKGLLLTAPKICTEVNGELLIGNEYFDTIEQLEREIDRIKSGRKHDE